MAKYGMVIDLTRCNGCYNCFLACRDEHCGNDYPPHSLAQPMTGHFWMRIIERERGKYPKVKVAYTPLPCLQCRDPLCMKLALNDAIYQRPDGIVMIDPEKAQGQTELITACPYRVIYWNAEKNIPQKCTFCAHLLDAGWKEPRCVEACPVGALVFGDISNPDSEVSKMIAAGKTEIFHPEYQLNPKVQYIGLPKTFIAGEVLLSDKMDECTDNVNVTLMGRGSNQTTKTNNFGDFEFEGLAPGEEFSVRIEYPGYVSRTFTVRTRTDVYLGEVILDRKP